MIQSVTVATYCLDDMRLAAEELAAQITIPLRKHSVGLLYCDSELDHAGLLRELAKRLPFPIVGCATIGMLDNDNLFYEYGASLTLLTSDDCGLAVAVSGPVTPDNVREEIFAAYRNAAQSLGDTPKMIFALPAHQLDVMLDLYPDYLSEASGGLPVFGGLPSATPAGRNQVFAEGEAYEDRLVLLLVGGAARPLFSIRNVLSNISEVKRTVTKSRGNVIERVGETTMVEYMKSFGLRVKFEEGEDTTLSFVSNPLLVEGTDTGDDGVPVVRAIHALDLKTGAVTAIGRVAEGSVVSIGQLYREDIEKSAMLCLEDLLRQMRENEADGYRYGTILCVSCAGRFLILLPDSGQEGKLLAREIGGRYTLSGMYGYGELCPTSIRNGVAGNKAHNLSITMCAL